MKCLQLKAKSFLLRVNYFTFNLCLPYFVENKYYIHLMDALVAVEKEGTRLNAKYESCRKSVNKHLEELIEHVESVKEGLCEGREFFQILFFFSSLCYSIYVYVNISFFTKLHHQAGKR